LGKAFLFLTVKWKRVSTEPQKMQFLKRAKGGLSFVTTSNLIEYIGHKGNYTAVLKIKQCPPY
jgi:hypothetical protein